MGSFAPQVREIPPRGHYLSVPNNAKNSREGAAPMDPTTEFGVITFADVFAAAYSPARIARSQLRNRILFARTSRGNYAKFQVHSGDDLRISRLVLYAPSGCIMRTASNLVIRSSFSCDLDNAVESSTGADFW